MPHIHTHRSLYIYISVKTSLKNLLQIRNVWNCPVLNCSMSQITTGQCEFRQKRYDGIEGFVSSIGCRGWNTFATNIFIALSINTNLKIQNTLFCIMINFLCCSIFAYILLVRVLTLYHSWHLQFEVRAQSPSILVRSISHWNKLISKEKVSKLLVSYCFNTALSIDNIRFVMFIFTAASKGKKFKHFNIKILIQNV